MPDVPLSINTHPSPSGTVPQAEVLQGPFLKLLEQHQAMLYQIIRTYCPNDSDWKDLEQEIVLQLWRSYPNFDATRNASTWVYRIAFNVTVTIYRKGRKRPKPTGGSPADHFFNRLPDTTQDQALAQRR
ncbi:MAG: sigma-70 family RNA polymerase sigma factor, partial [Bacteroidota bacterium]